MSATDEPQVITQPDYETPEQLKAHALDIGSPMVYQAAEYIETYHALYAKALVQISRLRGVVANQGEAIALLRRAYGRDLPKIIQDHLDNAAEGLRDV